MRILEVSLWLILKMFSGQFFISEREFSYISVKIVSARNIEMKISQIGLIKKRKFELSEIQRKKKFRDCSKRHVCSISVISDD